MIDILTNVDVLSSLAISIVAAVGMNLVYITGQLNLGQAGFFAIGAYAVAVLDTDFGWPLPVLLVCAAIAAALVAIPIAAGVRRLHGIYLIMGTLAVGELVRVGIGNLDYVDGKQGFSVPSSIELLGLVTTLVIVLGLAAALMASRWGLRMRSLFDDADAAASVGVAVARVKTFAVVVSAGVVGVAGGMYALWIRWIDPDSFDVLRSFDIALFSLIGGVHSLLGAVVGAVVVDLFKGQTIPELLNLPQSRLVAYGVLVMVLIAKWPEGIVSRRFAVRLGAPIRRWRRGRASDTAPATPAKLPLTGNVLELVDICHSYDGVEALDAVSLDVRAGEVLAVIGANGAGKTTLIDVVSGRVRSQQGVISLGGQRIEALPPERRSRLGIARTFQSVRMLSHLTVEENLRLGATAQRDATNADVETMLRRIGLEKHRDELPDRLVLADQRRLEIARAVMSRPRVLFLDEPSVGMVDSERAEIGELIRGFQRDGITIVIVDHNLDLALGIADRVAVLDFGHLIAVEPPDRIFHNAQVRSAYLGDVDPPDFGGDGAP